METQFTITVDWNDVEKNAVKDGAGNVHGVGVVKLPIRQPQREDLDRLRLEAEVHGLYLAYGSDGGLLAVALAHEIG